MAARIALVYASALLPLVLVVWLRAKGRLPRPAARLYGASFLICALGWELWFTYGLWHGEPVSARRGAALDRAIPQDVNWLLNSLADAGIVMVGWLLLRAAFGARSPVFRRWHWEAFGLLAVWFLGQNLFVELFVYHQQLALGHTLSWAPLAPTGPWWNPTLFAVGERTVRLHTQLSWVLMTALVYALILRLHREDGA